MLSVLLLVATMLSTLLKSLFYIELIVRRSSSSRLEITQPQSISGLLECCLPRCSWVEPCSRLTPILAKCAVLSKS